MTSWTVGVDFGGTNVKCGVVDSRGRVVRSLALPSARVGSPAVFVEALSGAIERLADELGVPVATLRGVGVGAPGPVDAARGIVHTLINLKGWRDVPLAARLRQRLRVPVVVENDVNLTALGEYRFGAGRGAHHLACLTLGTGVGGGLVLNGVLYRGAAGAAGEIGHMVVNPNGRRCACGARGCLEAQVGTAAILSLARRILRTRRRLTPELISRAAAEGNAAAREVWKEIGQWLGLGIANVVNLLNPDRVVIGGGVANAWRFFFPSLRRAFRAQAIEVSGRTVRIVRAQLGNHAGVVGGAVLVWDHERGGHRLTAGSRRRREGLRR